MIIYYSISQTGITKLVREAIFFYPSAEAMASAESSSRPGFLSNAAENR